MPALAVVHEHQRPRCLSALLLAGVLESAVANGRGHARSRELYFKRFAVACIALADTSREKSPRGDVTAETVEQPASWTGLPAAADRAHLPEGTRVGRLTITKQLGAGGMGVVYAATDPELDRNVALKFMRPKSRTTSEESQARARVMREARAMAKISHPNVITVFDVGRFEDDVYVAMEMIEGQTLAEWLDESPRTWREILSTYVKAGRGLAAAHAAGLIHRDFKPDNVLMDTSGRVKVTDFGLVGHGPSAADSTTTGSSPAHLDLTATNAVMGTPRYMAPEQYEAAATSAATDQFNFCVALYESLCGVNPFGGTTLPDRYKAIVSGTKQTAKDDRDVPAWIVPILERGLSVKPEDRHGSMDALLRLLARDPAVRRKRALAAGGLVAIAAVAGALTYRAMAEPADHAASICKSPERHLVGVWDDSVKASSSAAFRKVGASFAETTWKGVSDKLDRYVGEWKSAHTEACERTHRYKEQSPAVLDLRMACLQERRTELATLTQLFAKADSTTVQMAVRAVHGLAPIARCSDLTRLQARVRDPGPDKREAVAQVRDLVAKAKTLGAAGKYKAAETTATEALTRANKLGFRSLKAEAGRRLGFAQEHTGNRPLALKTLKTALWNAEASSHDHMVMLIWVARLHMVAKDGERSPVVESYVERASAALARHKNRPQYLARLQGAFGALRLKQGKFQQAYTHFSRALKVWKTLLRDPNAPSIPHAQNNLGLAEVELGKYADAERHFKAALDGYRRRLGPGHPRVAQVMGNLGLLLVATGRAKDAVPLYEAQLKILVAYKGASSPEVATARNNLGNAYTRLGKLQTGLTQLQQALRLRETLLGANHPDVASTLHAIAIVLRKAGKLKHALNANERAVFIMERNFGGIDGDAALMVLGLAETRMLRKEFDKATALLNKILPIEIKARGATSPGVRRIHMLLAISAEQSKRPEDSIMHYQNAVNIPVNSTSGRVETARLRMMLARALYVRARGDDRKLARAHAQRALDHFKSTGASRHVDVISRWLRTHK